MENRSEKQEKKDLLHFIVPFLSNLARSDAPRSDDGNRQEMLEEMSNRCC